VWNEKRNVNILANILSTSAKENVYDENRKYLKTAIVRDY
jgi:hypothetical protein